METNCDCILTTIDNPFNPGNFFFDFKKSIVDFPGNLVLDFTLLIPEGFVLEEVENKSDERSTGIVINDTSVEYSFNAPSKYWDKAFRTDVFQLKLKKSFTGEISVITVGIRSLPVYSDFSPSDIIINLKYPYPESLRVNIINGWNPSSIPDFILYGSGYVDPNYINNAALSPYGDKEMWIDIAPLAELDGETTIIPYYVANVISEPVNEQKDKIGIANIIINFIPEEPIYNSLVLWNEVGQGIVKGFYFIEKTSGLSSFEDGGYGTETINNGMIISYPYEVINALRYLGLNDSPTVNQNMQFGYFFNGIDFSIFESGNQRFSGGEVDSEMVFKIKYVNGEITYYRDDELIYLSQENPEDNLFIIASLFQITSKFTNVKIVEVPNSNELVEWVGVGSDVIADDGSIEKPTGSANYDDGGYSVQKVENGFKLTFDYQESDKIRYLGLNETNTVDENIQFCFFFDDMLNIQIYEDGNPVGSPFSGNLDTKLEIWYINNKIRYYKDKVLLHESSTTPSDELYVMACLYDVESFFTNVRIISL
jgi:hypothetical protein